jgi:hypothetical protein
MRVPRSSRPLSVRFAEKVDVRGPDECWPWTGSAVRGYGMISHNGRNRRATHVAWELSTGGPVPDGKMMCHTCDNPRCVNPAHLFPGTMSDNIKDAVAKGRIDLGNLIPGYRKTLTHCKRGHPLPDKLNKRGQRACPVCQKMHQRRYDKRRRGYEEENKILSGHLTAAIEDYNDARAEIAKLVERVSVLEKALELIADDYTREGEAKAIARAAQRTSEQEPSPLQMLRQKRLEAMSRQGEAGERATAQFTQSLDTFARLYAKAPEEVSSHMLRFSDYLLSLALDRDISPPKKRRG